MVSIEDFNKLDLRIGKIVAVEDVENADRLYVIKVDLGGEVKQMVAGIKPWYTKEELEGKKIVVVANLDTAVIRGIESQAMLLAAQDGDKISLITVDRDVSEGSQVK